MNPDTFPEEGCLEKLLETVENYNDIAMVTPLTLLNKNSKEFSAYGNFDNKKLLKNSKNIMEVNWVNGNIFLMNKKLDFFERVYDVVSKIPSGRVSTYGAIASFLGTKNSARVVGWAMNASHLKGNIPAHRVVNRIGLLTGKNHFFGTNLMQQLLQNEGIEVKNNQVTNFKNIFPSST